MNIDSSLIINLESLSVNLQHLFRPFPQITNLTANKIFIGIVHLFYEPIIIIKYILLS